MTRSRKSQEEPQEEPQEPRVRKASESRQTLLDAADGKQVVLSFDTGEAAKAAAYLWWANRRRASLTGRVAVSLDATAKTVTIGPRQTEDAKDDDEPQAGDAEGAKDEGEEAPSDDVGESTT